MQLLLRSQKVIQLEIPGEALLWMLKRKAPFAGP